MHKIDRLEQSARVATIFGDTNRAVHLYGKAIDRAWNSGCSGVRISDLMIKASDALTQNGMPDDAFEGLRSLSMTFIRRQEPEFALRLCGHLPTLFRAHPDLFPNAPALCVFIKRTCKTQMDP
jgi:hypothetical protein